MTKLVNLDELQAPKRQIKFRGVIHEVLDLELEDFIAFQQDFNRLMQVQMKGEVAEMIAVAEIIIKRCVPSFEEVKSLNMRQLMAVVQLISDFYPSEGGDEGNAAGSPAPTA